MLIRCCGRWTSLMIRSGCGGKFGLALTEQDITFATCAHSHGSHPRCPQVILLCYITRPMAFYGTGIRLLRMAVSLIQKLCRNPLDPARKRAEESSLTYHQLMASLPIPVARVGVGSIRSPRNNEKSRGRKYPTAAVRRIGAPGGTRTHTAQILRLLPLPIGIQGRI